MHLLCVAQVSADMAFARSAFVLLMAVSVSLGQDISGKCVCAWHCVCVCVFWSL